VDLIRILFVSDTHLGIDSPSKPRVERRRRGPDFFANFERALAPARRKKVDLVVHGGDMLYRSRVSAELVHRAMRPLMEVADGGVPVYLVPGNHERSRIPCALLAQHERLHFFDRPRSYVFERSGFRLTLAGFPYAPDVRSQFTALVEGTGYRLAGGDATLLVIHHAVEGARVGPGDFTFRNGRDVIRRADLPKELTAVLSGHIHRAQALTGSSDDRGEVAPVLYAGSIERTSFAEKNEKKGYLTLAIATRGSQRGKLLGWRFHELPARPMVCLELTEEQLSRPDLREWLGQRLGEMAADSVVQIRAAAPIRDGARAILSAASLRALAPRTMNVTVAERSQRR
jgi:exonuclease SbcD